MHLSSSVSCRAGSTGLALVLLVAFASALPAQQPEPGPKTPIGEVFGKPVYREDLETRSLQQLILQPVLAKYRKDHQADIEPTEAEIQAVTAYFDQRHKERMRAEEPKLRERLSKVEEQLAQPALTRGEQQKLEVEKLGIEARLRPPGRPFARFLLENWKFQRLLYNQYGGGRILWQQAGLEAFDAMHRWLEEEERKGAFTFNDPKLRASFYTYWTVHNHGPFLTADPQRIRREFLEPEWFAGASAKD